MLMMRVSPREAILEYLQLCKALVNSDVTYDIMCVGLENLAFDEEGT